MIGAIVPELVRASKENIALHKEYSSGDSVMDRPELLKLLTRQRLLLEANAGLEEELLR